jgi:hypothetical protein
MFTTQSKLLESKCVKYSRVSPRSYDSNPGGAIWERQQGFGPQ